MTVFVKKVQNNIRSNEKCFGKYYGRVAILGEVGIGELANIIQENSTLKRAEILAVLSELGPAIKRQLQKSFKVRIPYLGVFKMSMKSEGVVNIDDYDVRKHVKALKVQFIPETTVDQGHRVKELISGSKLAILPKKLFSEVIADDDENENGPSNGQGNGGVEVTPENPGSNDGFAVEQP